MSRIWRWVGGICAVLLVLGLALIAVAYASGSSLTRLTTTTDILDMTKFFTREQLEEYVRPVAEFLFGIFG